MPTDPLSSRPRGEADGHDVRGRTRDADDDLYDDVDARTEAHRAADKDHDGIAALLDAQLQAHPVATLLVAVAAGWIVGKILR